MHVCVCVCDYMCVCVTMCVQLLSSLTLCDPMDYNLPGFSAHGVFQARIAEWVAISTPGDLPDPGIKPLSPESAALAAKFLTTEPSGKPQSGLTLKNT